jgi:hypothetical protein
LRRTGQGPALSRKGRSRSWHVATEDEMKPVTYRVPGAVFTEREHVVPLDHARPDGPKITIFSRELAHPDGLERPYLLFLQGGPGSEATWPTSPPSGWMKRALRGLPSPPPGPARHRPIDTGRERDPRRDTGGPGDLPDPLPGRFDRPGTPSSSGASSRSIAGACSARASAASPR